MVEDNRVELLSCAYKTQALTVGRILIMPLTNHIIRYRLRRVQLKRCDANGCAVYPPAARRLSAQTNGLTKPVIQ